MVEMAVLSQLYFSCYELHVFLSNFFCYQVIAICPKPHRDAYVLAI
jgi:hypothetical protein